MLKKMLAITLAAVMAIMPMTASAVTWDAVVSKLYAGESYTGEGLTATLAKGQTENDDVYTITGGELEMEDYYYKPGTYNFIGVTFEGDAIWLNAYNGNKVVFNIDKDCVDKMDGGVMAFIGSDGEIVVNTDMDIASDTGAAVSVASEGSGKFSISGDGKIIALPFTDELGEEARYLPVMFRIYKNTDSGELPQEEIDVLLDYAKNNIHYDQAMLDKNEDLDVAALQIIVSNEEGEIVGYLSYDMDEEGNIVSWEFESADEEENESQSEMTLEQKAWLEEQEKIARENHERELKRHAEAIGGVTASPEWVKQLFLGYMSLNLRMYENGEQILFREKLAWAGDGTKNLTLRVNIEEPQALTVRLDEVVLDKLEQAEISLITLLAKDGTPVMQYKVSDLRGAYTQYGLAGADLLVVGGADDEVMKIGADGEMKPVEAE